MDISNSPSIVNDIFNPPAIGPGDYVDDEAATSTGASSEVISSEIIDELRKFVEIDQVFNGKYSSLINLTKTHIAAFNFTRMDVCKNVTVTVLYNDTAMHSLPVALNMLANAIYSKVASMSEDSATSSRALPIILHSHPLMVTAQSQEFNLGTFSSALFIGMIFILIPVSLAIDMVYDREMQAKNQLRVNGLSLSLYFLAFFIVIFALMILICGCLLIMVFAMDIPSFQQPSALATIFIFVILYSPSAILCSTCASYFFDRTDSALTFLPNILTFAGFVPFVLVAFLDMMAIDPKATITIHYVLSILNPMYIPYALIYFVDRIYIACSISSACANLSIINYMTEEIVVILVSSVLHIPVWWIGLQIADIKKSGGRVRDVIRKRLKGRRELEVPVDDSFVVASDYEDEDVKIEREKVARMTSIETEDGGSEGDSSSQPIVVVKVRKKPTLCSNFNLFYLESS